MSRKPIQTHVTRFSDSSRFDEVCLLCGMTDAFGAYSINKDPCVYGSQIDPSHVMKQANNPELGYGTVACEECGFVWAGKDRQKDKEVPKTLRMACVGGARGGKKEEVVAACPVEPLTIEEAIYGENFEKFEPIVSQKTAELRIETEKFDLLYTFKPTDDSELKAKEVVDAVMAFFNKVQEDPTPDLSHWTETPHGPVRGSDKAIVYVCELVSNDTINKQVGPHLAISGNGFRADLRALINAYGVDSSYSIPDYALADYLQSCIESCGLVTKRIAVHQAGNKERILNG